MAGTAAHGSKGTHPCAAPFRSRCGRGTAGLRNKNSRTNQICSTRKNTSACRKGIFFHWGGTQTRVWYRTFK
eukprot:scaffold802_cov280-Pinguiococcus_pyrenoidosus.AAC.1